MADEHDVVEALPLDDVDDISDVGRKVHLAVDEVRTLAQPRHRRREHLCPLFCRRSATRRQHQPPCQAPCTSTKVLGAPVCAAAGGAPKAASAAPAPSPASTPPRGSPPARGSGPRSPPPVL